MGKNRLEALSDGVIAIIITVMVLELKVPHGESWDALKPLWPVFLSYVLSFVYLGTYWNSHHHTLHTCKHVSGPILWANLHFLFWLSLIPFSTAWVGENHFANAPAAVYGIILWMAAVAFFLLQRAIIASQGASSLLKRAIGKDLKGTASATLYTAGVLLAFVAGWLSMVLYIVVVLIWFIPDRRIERTLGDQAAEG